MQGKVFAESVNLYQDQARILYNYYKKAAEKVVKEETDLEKSIASAKAEIEISKKNKLKGIIIIGAFVVAGVIIGIVSGGIGFVLVLGGIWGGLTLLKAFKSIKENETKIVGFEEAHRDIRRNYSVKKLGVAYVPIATQVPFEDRSFMVDHTGMVQNTDFSISVVKDPDKLLASLADLENGIREAPIVEQATAPEEIDTADYSTSMQQVTMYDYMGNIDRQVRNIRYILSNNDTVSLSLPVIMPKGKIADFISEFTTSDPEGKPLVPVFNIDGFKEKIDTFYMLNDVKKNFEKNTSENQIQYFKKLIMRLAESVQILSRSKMNSSSKIIEYSNMIFSAVLKSAFNQYSPAIEAEEIERIRQASFDYQESVDDYTPFSLKSSSRVRYDLFSTAWIAEDQSRTSMPFGMHQIQEEILAPVIQNLMAENRIERLKIYNNIKDQKLDYLNQWHRDTEDFYGRNRAEAADLINRMRESYADYIRSFNTYKALQETQIAMNKTRSLSSAEVHEVDKDAEIIAGFEVQAAQFNQKQEEFSDYMDRLKESIDQKAAEFGYIPYYEATLRDKEYRDIAQSTDQLQELDPRRKKLIAISPYIAKFAKLPPAPQVEQQMYDDFSIDLIKEALEEEAMEEAALAAEKEKEQEAPPPNEDTPPVEEQQNTEDSGESESAEEDSGGTDTDSDKDENAEDDDSEDEDEEDDDSEDEEDDDSGEDDDSEDEEDDGEDDDERNGEGE